MSPCDHISTPGGGTAVVCGPRRRAPRCSVRGCGAEGSLLCDGPPPAASRRETCDLPICPEHALEIGPDRHLCPGCAANADVEARQA